MKREELEALGLTKEQVDKVCDMHHAEIDPVKKDLENAQGELTAEKEKTAANDKTIGELKKNLEGFKDVDVSELTKKINTLQEELKAKEDTYQKDIADRDFNSLLKDSISAANGRNAKAISALLDVDTLKVSKNQKEDITAAIKALTEAEDSKMLFGEPEANPIGKGNPIGSIGSGSAGDAEIAQMRAVMGLPPTEGDK